MISQQSCHKGKLGVHPALLKPGRLGNQQTNRHRNRNHHPRGRDDVGEALLHQAVLLLEGHAQFWFQLFSFNVIDEQPHQIEEACKPNHNTNDVECFEPEIGLRGKRHHKERYELTIGRVQVIESRNASARR